MRKYKTILPGRPFGQRLFIAAFMLTLALCSTVNAQTYIDEDFLDNIGSNAKPMLSEPAPDFAINTTPSKWDKESAVVIGYSRSVQFDRTSRGGFLTRKERSLWFVEKDRLKIRLNDNNSVDAFSKIYFRYGTKEDGFIAHIIKPDGSIVNVDLKSAVGVEDVSDVPEYFKSFFDQVANSQYNYYKVAIPGLEPGDILEYVTNTRSKLDVTSAGLIQFEPVYEVCSKGYPVMYNSIAIETDDKSYFKYLSMNGAPKFVKESATDNDFYRYVFVDRDRATEKDVNFVSTFLQYPMVKFQVIYSNKDDAKGAFIGEKGELKSEFTKEELAKKAWEGYAQSGQNWMSDYTTVQGFVDACWSELTKTGAKDWTDKQYVDRLYYLLRNKILFRSTYMSDKLFAYAFNSLLDKRDIKSELIISVGNNIGSLKEVLFTDEIRYVTRVGDKLYFNTTDFSNPGEPVESLLGNEAYIITEPARKTGAQEIKPFTLPGTTAADNVADVVIKSELSTDMKKLLIIRTTTYTGLQKTISIANALRFTPYMVDDYKNYNGNSPTDKMKDKEAESYNNYVRALKDEYKKQKPEYVKDQLESEFDQTVDDIHFDIVSDGRSQKKNSLIVKEGFSVGGFIRKAGKKYMINLPGLIGSQLQVRKEERARQYDINVRYPKTFSWTINFKIPDGYIAQGLTELNKSIDNSTGSFSLTAKEDNGNVMINIVKVYKQRNLPKDKWNDMLAFLDAAYNSSFKYILLAPK
jgi:hypothetical protein